MSRGVRFLTAESAKGLGGSVIGDQNTSADLSATSPSPRFDSTLNFTAFAVVNREIVYH
jgi:hypothetical protein